MNLEKEGTHPPKLNEIVNEIEKMEKLIYSHKSQWKVRMKGMTIKQKDENIHWSNYKYN